MYHTHEATQRHDKVYALLGMSSDDASKANLLPNYGIPWEELFRRLTQFLLSEKICVETWRNKEIAVIKSKGYILGKVSSVRSNTAWNGGQEVDVTFNGLSKQPSYKGERGAHWTLQFSAKSIQDGDLICLLQGASKPTIIRLCEDYFALIMVAVPQTESGGVKWPDLFQSAKVVTREFLLVWDLEKLQDSGKYETLIQQNSWASEHSTTYSEDRLENGTRLWNMALILEDVEEQIKAREKFQEAIEGYEKVVGEDHLLTVESQYSQMSLWLAVKNGHEVVVKLLLKIGKADIENKDEYGRTALLRAVMNKHEAMVKLLLEIGKADVENKDEYGQTALSRAVMNKHEAMVKLLLEIGKADVENKDENGQTALMQAIVNKHEAMVKLLLEIGKADVENKDEYSWTALLWAVESGHEAIVKLLLEIGKADVENKDKYGRTALLWAVESGHEAIVKLLQLNAI
jgi:ankyrin repeat protein